MSDNPYESPKIPNDGATSSRPPKLDENVKEFLGIAKDDFWYYPGLVLLVIGCFLPSAPLVLALFAGSTVFLLIFLAKSFPKYIQSSQLSAIHKGLLLAWEPGVDRTSDCRGRHELVVFVAVEVFRPTWHDGRGE